MLGEKMEEYILDQLKGKDAVIKELQDRVKRLEWDVKHARDWEEELKSALKALGREVELIIQEDGEEYIRPRKNDWITQKYETRDLLTLRAYIKTVRDERKEQQRDEMKEQHDD